MIAFIKGNIADIEEDNLIIDVNGIGYQVYAPLDKMLGQYSKDDEIMLYIYEHIREDAWQLYGFTAKDDLNIFKLLISINGVGARLGLTIMNSLTIDAIVGSVVSGNTEVFCSISGIGKKIAQRLTLELKDKVSKFGINGSTEQMPVKSDAILKDDEAMMALIALGYTASEVKTVIHKLLSKDNFMSTDDIIRQGLKELSRL